MNTRHPEHARTVSPPSRARRITIVLLALTMLFLLALIGLVLAGIGAIPIGNDLLSASGAERSDPEPDPVSLAFVPYWDQVLGFQEVDRHADKLSAVGPWWYAPDDDGNVVEQHDRYTDIDLERVRGLQERGMEVIPAIANHRGGYWDFDVMDQILADPERIEVHAEALTELVLTHDYDGIQLDYENLSEDNAEAYAELVRQVSEGLDDHDRTVAVAVHAKLGPDTSGWGAGHDYELLGRYADEVHLMAYDLHYDTSEPGPPAPAWWIDEVLRYITSVVPAEKVILGLGLYGYDWPVDDPEEQPAEGVTLQQAEERIERHDGDLTYDVRSQTARFDYTDDDREREMWFETPRSLERKLEFVTTYGLGGVFYWRMGGTTDQVWETIGETLELPRG